MQRRAAKVILGRWWVAGMAASVLLAGCGGGSEEAGSAQAGGVGAERTAAAAAAPSASATQVQALVASGKKAPAAHERLRKRPARDAEIGAAYSSGFLVSELPEGVSAVQADVVSLQDPAPASLPKLALNGALSWTPTAADAGKHVFMARIWFSDGKVAEKLFSVMVGRWQPLLNAGLSASAPQACSSPQGICAEIANLSRAAAKSAHVTVDEFPMGGYVFRLLKKVTGELLAHEIRFRVNQPAVLALPAQAAVPNDVSKALVQQKIVEVSRASVAPEELLGPADALSTLTKTIKRWSGLHLQFYNPDGGGISIPSDDDLIVTASGDDVLIAYFCNKAIDFVVAASLHGACNSAATCTQHTTAKPPVLLIHGFNMGCELGGGEGTYGQTDQFVKNNLGVAVFEFKWNTCMRFSEAATLLGSAAKQVEKLTGVAPVVMAHSFGGVVASMYLKGKAVAPVWNTTTELLEDQPRRYAANGLGSISQLITVGSPLSGIANKPYTWASAKTSLTQGRDSGDLTIKVCQQITCKEAGMYFGDVFTFGPFYSNGVNLAKDVWRGFDIYAAPGGAIKAIQSVKYPTTVAVTTLVGDRLGQGVAGYKPTTRACDFGDGLISVAGQAVMPSDLFPVGANPYKTTTRCAGGGSGELRNSNFEDGYIASRSDAAVRYRFLRSAASIRLADGSKTVDVLLRFGHTGGIGGLSNSGSPVIEPTPQVVKTTNGTESVNAYLVFGELADMAVTGNLQANWNVDYVTRDDIYAKRYDAGTYLPINVQHPVARVLLDIYNPTNPPAPTGKLPDTGITATQCYAAGSDALVDCSSAAAKALNSSQDGMLGRDVSTPSNANGKLGFAYTKIAADGSVLPPSSSTWACVKDQLTGLMWEVKTADGSLRDVNKTYTNYGDGRSGDASAFVAAVNAAGLCGKTDWRLPTVDELQGLVDYGVAYNSGRPTIDETFFPNTAQWVYWTSSPLVGGSNYAWYVDFSSGLVYHSGRGNDSHVRLVR